MKLFRIRFPRLNQFQLTQNKNCFLPYKTFATNIELSDFIRKVDDTLNDITDQLDELDLDITDNIALAGGVLKLSFANTRHYVLNIQRPNKQLWFSSPFSGPQRFEYDSESNTWKNIRDNKELYSILNEEINVILKEAGDKTKSVELTIKY